MTPKTVYQRFHKKRITTVTRLEYDKWIVNVADEARLEAAEIRFLRWMLSIPWTDHKTNDNVLNRAGTDKPLLTIIRTRHAEFLGDVIRNRT